MTKKFKLLLVTLLIICFTSTLFGCTNSNEVTDNKETTSTTAENKTTKPTTTEPATEEPTTEEATTEFSIDTYEYKGTEWKIAEDYAELFKDLTVENGFKFYVNDYILEENENSDYSRGCNASDFIYLTNPDNADELWNYLDNTYTRIGDPSYYIPKDDNFYIEYKGSKKIIFELVYCDGTAYFDVHEVTE